MAPSYKLYYFNARARAELIRLVFHAAGVEFVDERIEFADWPALKPKAPNGQLPFLEIDGAAYPESLCLARYIARKYNLMGKNEIDSLRADVVVAQCDSVRNDWIRFTFDKVLTDAQKAELKKKFEEETVPAFLANIEKNIGTDTVLGDVTIAELAVYDVLDAATKEQPSILDKSPKVAALMKRVAAVPGVAKYVASRPKTDF